MKFLVAVFFCIVVSASALDSVLLHKEWQLFKTTFNKVYGHIKEEQKRFSIFVDNVKKIEEHNQLFNDGFVTYKKGVNKFADLTHEELRHLHHRFEPMPVQNMTINLHSPLDTDDAPVDIPDYVDWREAGAVTPVKDQGECGSCWTFATTGAIEGQYFIQTGELENFSEQNILDCSADFGTHGCISGNIIKAYRYLNANGGLDTEESYPYEGLVGTCRYRPEFSKVHVTGQDFVWPNDEQDMIEKLATKGPVASSIDASPDFHAYSSGIFIDETCSDILTNHAILIVGYGSENGLDYYIVKNSWGENWGENGYVRMARNRNSQCAIATFGSIPSVEVS